jgi:lysophospholipase L1-like esterase
MRDDNGQTIVTSGISAAKFTNNGEGFTIDLAEGLFESRVRINGGTITEWENGRFVNPSGGGRYLTLLQSFAGVPDDPSALEALYAVLAETYVRSVNGTPVDPVTGDVEVAATVDEGQLNTAVATKTQPLAPRRAPSIVFLGDSNTQIGTTEASRSYGNSFPHLACWASAGRMIFAANAGVASDTVQQIAARVNSEVIARKPGRCFVLAGSNSTTKGYSHFNDARSVYETGIILPLLAAGIEPILATIPPRDFARTSAAATNTGPQVYQLTLAWNVFVRAMAAKYRLPLVDIYLQVTDPDTGNFKDSYSGDGVHWGYAGAKAVADFVKDSLLALFPTMSVPLEKDRYSLINLASSPLFLNGTGSGPSGAYPPGWSSGSSLANLTPAIIDPVGGDGLEAGKWLRLTKVNDSGGNANMIKTFSTFAGTSGITPVAGDRLAFGLRYKTEFPNLGANDAYVTIALIFRGAGGTALKTLTPLNQVRRPTSGVIWIEDTIPADAIDVRLDVTFSTVGAATVHIGQNTIVDLTAMGVPPLTAVDTSIPTSAFAIPADPATPTPAKPAALTAGTPTSSTIPLTLGAATGATSHEVQYRIGEGAWIVGYTGASTSPTISGLAESTSYKVRHRGINATGPGWWSDTITVATPAAGAPPTPVMLTSDSFDRADTAAGSLGTTDIADGGSALAWSVTGQLQILSNQVGASALSTTRFASVDVGVTDMYVETVVAAIEGGVTARFTSDASYYSLRYAAVDSKLYLERRAGGTTTALWSSTAGIFTPGAGQTLGLSVQGSALVPYMNGTAISGGAVSDSTVTTGTRAGIRSSFSNIACRYDNFKVQDIAA